MGGGLYNARGGSNPSSSARTSPAEGYLPLRKKNQSISPMITKTIRRANKKNASISSMGDRLAKGLAAFRRGVSTKD